MLDQHAGTYAWDLGDLTIIPGYEYKIEVMDPQPICLKQYHQSRAESDFAAKWVEELIKAQIVVATTSPYVHPVVVAPKKDATGAWVDFRYNVDYRKLNLTTVADKYPAPVPDELMSRLSGAYYFSTLDAKSAFHQVAVHPDTKPMLAFHANGRQYTWNRMPFGGKNSVAVWQRLIDDCLAGLEDSEVGPDGTPAPLFAMAYADDIMVYSKTAEEHGRHLALVLNRLEERGVKLSPSKMHLGMQRIEFLGHIVSGAGIAPMYSKVAAVRDLPPPSNVREVRAFLGSATYYCRHLPQFHRVKKPLTDLTKLTTKWQWTDTEQQAFEGVKAALMSAPVLRAPDWNLPFQLHTDFSALGVGCTLSQVGPDGVEYAIAYASRMNSGAEASLASYEGELLAIVFSIQRFRYYLYGRHFELFTDNRAIEWFRVTAKLKGKLARWALILAEYDFDVKYRPGAENNADMFSRQPNPDECMQHGLPGREERDARLDVVGHQGMGAFLCTSLESLYHDCMPSIAVALAARVVGYASADSSPATGALDIWKHPLAISYAKGELQPTELTAEQRAYFKRRLAAYTWESGVLWFTGADGTRKQCPPPEERAAIAQSVHVQTAHLGRDRTISLLRERYHWANMYQDCADCVKQCPVCDRVKASFEGKKVDMQPLPIAGLFYRVHIDSAGPFAATKEGHQYVIVIIEAFSKWIELVPVHRLDSATTARVFQERFLSRFGAPVELVSDNGVEYMGEFAAQLREHGIQQRRTRRNNPQANGQCERIMQILKDALRKYVLAYGSLTWHLQVPVLEFGYRVTVQRTTGFSPYFMLYGRSPVMPSQLQHLQPVDPENPEEVLALLSERAVLLQQAMPVAFERHVRAQLRDTVRFRARRTGELRPRRVRFPENSYVYLDRRPVNTLDVSTSRVILRVHEVLASGKLVLQDSAGKQITVNPTEVAPCHLGNLVAPTGLDAALPCKSCNSTSFASPMLQCSLCSKGQHVSCVRPALQTMPEEDWVCDDCVGDATPDAMPFAAVLAALVA
jgi:hypothetical protein